MPVLLFSERFTDDVLLGNKKQSVRRGKTIQMGDRLVLRSAVKDLKLRSTHCDELFDIHIDANTVVILNNNLLIAEQKHQLALDDGFESFREMIQYFRDNGGLPLDGQLVRWL